MPGAGPSRPTGALSTDLHATTAPHQPVGLPLKMPIVEMSWRRTLHRPPRSSTKLHSAEVLTSTSTGAHIKPLDPVLDLALDKPIDPELCSLHAASSLIEPQLRPLPAGFVLDCSTWTHRHLHGRRTRLAIDRCCSARRPDHRDSRWGRPAHQPPHCSPMGISWGSIPQGSPLSNHPSRRRRAQVRLAATAERWGGFGTCVQERTTGGQRTQLYLTYLALRLSARPDPARRAGATTRLGTGALSPQSRPPPLGQRSLHGTPGAGCASLRVHELTRGQSYPTTRTGHLPADLAFSLMPQLHDAMEAGTGRPSVQECVDTHGASSTTRTTRRGHHHSQNCPIDAQGLSIRAGDYHPWSAASG